MKKIFFYLGLLLILLGAFFMIYAIEYFFDFFHYFDSAYLAKKQLSFTDMFFRKNIDFWLVKKDKVNDSIWASALYLHVIGSLTAILTGPIQFLPAFRNHFLTIHRTLGKAYIGSILLLGVPTGAYMALYANGGLWASIGFGILSILWFVTTYIAYKHIKRRQIQAHRNAMIRSYAITFAAVMLRVWTDVLPRDFGVDHQTTIVVCAWLSWIPNIILAEIMIFLHNKGKLKDI